MVKIPTANRILVIDDDPDIREFLAEVVAGLGLEVNEVTKPAAFLADYRAFRPDVILLDLMMPDVDGIQVLETLAKEGCAAEIVLLSGADDKVIDAAARVAAAVGLGIRGCLRKPIDLAELESILSNCQGVSATISERDLAKAIAEGEITAHYQPKVSLCEPSEWHVEGVEALARWNHPQLGSVPPNNFIPLAESTGLIDSLTDVIVDTALAHTRRLSDLGFDIDVAVNVSGTLLHDATFPDRLTRQLDEHQVSSSRFIMEITESVALADGASAMADLTRFRLKGIRLAMDDFGTGYSSLIQLHRMPFSELKIDMSFLRELDDSRQAEVVVRSIVDLGHNLGLSVCAEGVETRKSLEFLKAVNCDQAQGFLISPPLPEQELLSFLANNQNGSLMQLTDAARREQACAAYIRTAGSSVVPLRKSLG